jgi:predicted HTH transcriptional regulator
MKEKGKRPSDNAFVPQNYSLSLGDQMKELSDNVEKYKAVADNPFMFSQIFLGLKASMDNFNNLIYDLNKKLSDIEARIAEIESSKNRDTIELSKKDQEILDYVMTQERVTAEDLQKEFNYKGKHAASARLHKLFAMGALDKVHSGRTVHYIAPKP